jgi:hypothetical protein
MNMLAVLLYLLEIDTESVHKSLCVVHKDIVVGRDLQFQLEGRLVYVGVEGLLVEPVFQDIEDRVFLDTSNKDEVVRNTRNSIEFLLSSIVHTYN